MHAGLRGALVAVVWGGSLLAAGLSAAAEPPVEPPRFSRHVIAVFSRAGCNGGSCHGAVQGQNGFRLSLFGAWPADDHAQLVRQAAGRRLNLLAPEQSLVLLKATGQVPHRGGRVLRTDQPEYALLRRWIEVGAPLDDVTASRVTALRVEPASQVLQVGQQASLAVTAEFADGSREDVTGLCSYSASDGVAEIDQAGRLAARRVGDAAILVRYRGEPAVAQVVVASPVPAPWPDVAPHNPIDAHILAKLRRLGLPPAGLCDDATFLRRARLDVTGQLPSPAEVRAFLADPAPDKRARKIEQLLAEPGYAAVWTLKFCDLLRASDFGVYADGLADHYEAPRFQAWIRARLEENLPYDELAARILTATSRDGRSLEEWSQEVIALQEGYQSPRRDLEVYARRHSLDAWWQRKGAVGLPGSLQVAHAFLGVRLECAQCHRHPHDVWQQDDLLSFANFFMRVRTVGFQGDNEKKYPAEAELFHKLTSQGKELAEQVKQLKEGRGKELAERAKQAEQALGPVNNQLQQWAQQAAQHRQQAARLRQQANNSADQRDTHVPQAADLERQAAELDKQAAELRAAHAEQLGLVAENQQLQEEIRHLERRSKLLGDEIAKRVLHAQVMHRGDEQAARQFASVTNPLGTQSSERFRLLGELEPVDIPPGEDPRAVFVAWLRRPDNPLFAKAIVNRVWAHYFGRGIIDPPDDLSPLNPPTHPELLADLCRQFVADGYDLKWLHRQILTSRTYQQASQAGPAAAQDQHNYARFYLRRLPAEVLLDALNQATGTTEDMGMAYYHWRPGLRTVEIPYLPQNSFVTFVLEQFGRPARNSSVQCDCERVSEASMLQVLSLANHPRLWQKVADPAGRVAEVLARGGSPAEQAESLFLAALCRLPDEAERQRCVEFVAAAESPEKGWHGVLWSLLNTREFLLQH